MKKLLIMNYITTVISNLLNRYIHLYWTGPPTFTSYGKCTGRCSIESKNDGGNIISSLHIVSMIFVATQFLTHVLINFQKNSKIAKNIENPKNTFFIYLHRF
jgi:hypothetical protein